MDVRRSPIHHPFAAFLLNALFSPTTILAFWLSDRRMRVFGSATRGNLVEKLPGAPEHAGM